MICHYKGFHLFESNEYDISRTYLCKLSNTLLSLRISCFLAIGFLKQTFEYFSNDMYVKDNPCCALKVSNKRERDAYMNSLRLCIISYESVLDSLILFVYWTVSLSLQYITFFVVVFFLVVTCQPRTSVFWSHICPPHALSLSLRL